MAVLAGQGAASAGSGRWRGRRAGTGSRFCRDHSGPVPAFTRPLGVPCRNSLIYNVWWSCNILEDSALLFASSPC